jgi:hypothetical protein
VHADDDGGVAQFAPVYELIQEQEQVAMFDPEYVPDGEPLFPQDCPFAPVVHEDEVDDGGVAQFAPVYELIQEQEQVAIFDPEYVPDGEPLLPQDCPFAPVVHEDEVAPPLPLNNGVQSCCVPVDVAASTTW